MTIATTDLIPLLSEKLFDHFRSIARTPVFSIVSTEKLMYDNKLMGRVITETFQEHNIDARVRRVNGIWTVEMHNEKSQFIYTLKGDDYFCERIVEKLAMYDPK